MTIKPLAFAITAAISTPSLASSIEEIIVTANFRDVALTETAQSVTVVDAAAADARNATHIESLLALAPNIDFSSGSSRSRFIQVRGVGDLEQYGEPKYYPSVGVVVDGFELTHAGAATTFDMAQVEVLRGPQGTRYGASAHAGLVKLTTNAPTEEFEGNVTVGVGNQGAYQVGLVTSGAIADRVKARVAVFQNTSNGSTYNDYLKDDTANIDEFTLRATVDFDASDTSSYRFQVLNIDTSNGYDAYSFDNTHTTYSDQPGKDTNETLGFNLSGNWQLGNGELTATLTTSEADLYYSYDADWASQDYCVQYTCSYGIDTAQEIFARTQDRDTAEVRYVAGAADLGAGDSNFVIGAYYNKGDESLDYEYPSLWYGDYGSQSTYKTQRTAIYGEYGLGLTDKLSVTAGVRAERFEEDYSDSNMVQHSDSDTLTNAEISFGYELGNGHVYATLAGAQKPGGTNVSASSQYGWMSPDFQTFMAQKLQFGAESLFNKEIGYKGEFMGDRGLVRAALFHTDRSNAQLENWMWDDAAGLWIGYLDSTSDATSYGAELELDFAATEQLQLSASLGLLKTKVDAIEAFDQDLWGFVTKYDRDQAKSPEYTYHLGANYQFTDALSAGLTIEGKGKSYFGYYHDGQLEAIDLVNAHMAWNQGNLNLTLWARNLTDETYATHALYFGADPRDDFGAWGNATYKQLGERRTYGLTARYQF